MGPQVTYNYAEIVAVVVPALQQAFPNAAIDAEEGMGGRVHLKIVCGCFNGRGEKEKQEMVWSVIRQLPAPAPLGVGFVLPYGFDELP